MNSLLAELDRMIAQGAEIAAAANLESGQLQQWLAERGRLFAAIDGANGAMNLVERQTLRSLIEDILAVDAAVVAKAEVELRRVGDEIASMHKLKTFLAAGVNRTPHSWLRRAF